MRLEEVGDDIDAIEIRHQVNIPTALVSIAR